MGHCTAHGPRRPSGLRYAGAPRRPSGRFRGRRRHEYHVTNEHTQRPPQMRGRRLRVGNARQSNVISSSRCARAKRLVGDSLQVTIAVNDHPLALYWAKQHLGPKLHGQLWFLLVPQMVLPFDVTRRSTRPLHPTYGHAYPVDQLSGRCSSGPRSTFQGGRQLSNTLTHHLTQQHPWASLPRNPEALAGNAGALSRIPLEYAAKGKSHGWEGCNLCRNDRCSIHRSFRVIPSFR